MRFEVRIQCGLDGSEQAVCSMPVLGSDVDAIGQIAGSYHVLEMGRHFNEYVESPTFPLFHPIPGFPTSHFFSPLPAKVRGANITGNIGEAVAAIAARWLFELQIGEVAHIRTTRPFHRRRVPDYVFDFGRGLPQILALRGLFTGPLPRWWPAESKARHGEASAKAGVADAFAQLISYWVELAQNSPQDIGFGLIVSCVYDLGILRIHVFVPLDQNGLIDLIKDGNGPFAGYPVNAEVAVNGAKGFVYGC